MERVEHESTDLAQVFRSVYPDAGQPRICRAPGRVNLIGEHIDYNGLPVLPMTINREIRIAFARRPGGLVRAHNLASDYPPFAFRNCAQIAPSAPGSWANYCKAAFQGLNGCAAVADFPGMDMLVAGTIPVAAGLSSSSALVVACALAYLACLECDLGAKMTPLDLAQLLAISEQYVGTRGGGMDHAIILSGRKDHACKIDFFPLRIEPLPLPATCAIVVCNSMVKARKTGEMLERYNEGPLLGRLIRTLVEKQLQRDVDSTIAIERLGDLWDGSLCLTDREVAALLAATFPKEKTSLKEAAAMLGISPEEVRARWLGRLEEPVGGFPLQARARHQLTERQRVEAARDALLASDIESLGALMSASHASCAQDCGVSCPELNRLVDTALACGALGARLTGAGFGGCTVNLVPVTIVEEFRSAVERRYFGAYLGFTGNEPLHDRIMVVEATPSACVSC